MKTLAFVLLLSFAYDVCAQDSLFVRVYDLHDKKTHKGRIASITDSSLTLRLRDSLTTVPVSQIGSIRTRRSAGHNLLVGAVVGVAAGTILGVLASATTDGTFFSDTPASTWILSGAGGGALWGTAFGAATLAGKHSRRYSIDGDPMNWKAFVNRARPHYRND